MNEIKETEHAVTLFSTSEKVLDRIGKYTKLEIIDTASEKTVRKSRQLTKNLIVKIEKRRLKNNREFKQKNDETASTIKDRLTPVYDNLDVKIKAVEEKRDNIKNEKIMAEQERLKYINLSLEALSNLATAGDPLLSSEQLKQMLTWIKEDNLEEDEFQEFLERAQEIQLAGIKNTQTALDNRIKLEEETARLEEQKKVNDEALEALQKQKDTLAAESKVLAKEKSKLKEEKAKTEKIRLLALEKKEAEDRFKEEQKLVDALNKQVDDGQKLADILDQMHADKCYDGAHKENNVMNLGIERAAEMEEKYQEDLQFDRDHFVVFAIALNKIISVDGMTYAGKDLYKKLKNKKVELYEWLMTEANKLIK
jgi:hypothetical protein